MYVSLYIPEPVDNPTAKDALGQQFQPLDGDGRDGGFPDLRGDAARAFRRARRTRSPSAATSRRCSITTGASGGAGGRDRHRSRWRRQRSRTVLLPPGRRSGAPRHRAGMELSVVIPVKNEAGNIAPLVAEIAAALDGSASQYEIVYVDDGSTDATAAEIRRLQASAAAAAPGAPRQRAAARARRSAAGSRRRAARGSRRSTATVRTTRPISRRCGRSPRRARRRRRC